MAIKDERKALEDMIGGSRSSLEDAEIPLRPNSDIQMPPTFDMDFGKTKRNCQRRARSMIKRATGLMLSDEMIRENPYLKNKMQVDIISLTGLLYQLEVNEMMQETLMEEVRSGAAHPRMFEVFGNLSKTIGDLNKQLLQTVEAIKLTYRDVKGDIRERMEELKAIGPGESGIMRNSKGLVAMGTKELIKEARKLKNQDSSDNIQDITEITEVKE
jgi:hypothetical protein